jgi:hypothetical protein
MGLNPSTKEIKFVIIIIFYQLMTDDERIYTGIKSTYLRADLSTTLQKNRYLPRISTVDEELTSLICDDHFLNASAFQAEQGLRGIPKAVSPNTNDYGGSQDQVGKCSKWGSAHAH